MEPDEKDIRIWDVMNHKNERLEVGSVFVDLDEAQDYVERAIVFSVNPVFIRENGVIEWIYIEGCWYQRE